ncbi:MAG: chemotaxis protein CheW [Spirochaetaceae bacterium]|nr:MAG: chemotaxis protein CheW [Spirochaetaceae bacterium]
MSENAVSMTARQYLTFTLADEHYAVPVEEVKEVLEFSSVTRVPKTQAFMRGVINLRGSVIPVIDLRLKFGLDATEKTIATSIVVLELELGGTPITVGALADSVQEVISLDESAIEPPPRIGARINTDFIRGIGRQEDSFILLLDIDRIFSEEDMSAAIEDASPR